MLKTSFFVLSLVFLLSSAAIAQEEAKTFDLRPKFKVGNKATFETWSQKTQTVTVEAAGRTQDATVKTEYEGRIMWEVLVVHDDKSADCKMEIEWFKITATSPTGEQRVIDTREAPTEDTQSQHQFMSALTKKPITVTMGNDGIVQKIDGFDAVKQAMPDPQNSSMTERDMIEIATGLDVMPKVPEQLKANDTWDTDFTWGHEIGEMQYETTYKLAQVEDIAGIPVAIVDGTSKLTLKPDMEKINPGGQGPPMTIRLVEGSASGKTMFDLSRNEIVGRNGSERTVIEVSVEIPTPDGVQVLRRTMDERTQGQLLRVSEEDGA